MVDTESIKRYWDEQAKKLGADPRATTQDYWMRELEIMYLSRILTSFKEPAHILDIGCGNGYSTIKLSQAHPMHTFLGGDYSGEMIVAARAALETLPPPQRTRIRFEVMDILRLEQYKAAFDAIISDRCLINLPTRDLQFAGIRQVWEALKHGGRFVAIENFLGGQENLNALRLKLGLKPIAVRWHNNFFDEKEFLEYCSALFRVDEFIALSSSYYLITRVVFSRLCQLEGREPDYEHPIYEIATQVPIAGDFGPIKLAQMTKREPLPPS